MNEVQQLLQGLERVLRQGGEVGSQAALRFPLTLPVFEVPALPEPPGTSAQDSADMVSQVLDQVGAQLAGFDATITRGESLCDGIDALGEVVAELLSGGLEQVREVISEEITELFTDAFDELNEIFGGALDDVTEAADELIGRVEEFVEPAGEVAGLYTEFKPLFQAMNAL